MALDLLSDLFHSTRILMAKLHFSSLLLLVLSFFLNDSIFGPCSALDNNDDNTKVYIVYMGALREDRYSPQSQQLSILKQVLFTRQVHESLVYSYHKSFNGFAAKLTPEEQQRIARTEGVVAVFESKVYQLHTTSSWDFLGFPTTVRRNLELESDVIIGVIDSGAWPESESFNDNGFGPPPKRWKGICQTAGNFTCNNKLIGARFYPEGKPKENDSARDTEGHGTHTASTAAGREVKGASLFGLERGTARGAVPSARIAVYKACWEIGCTDHSILAAFDDAIADGVDILSVSLGPPNSMRYDVDSLAIGSFYAMRRGILTSQAAGNHGPLSSVAPWSLTVAASSTDRHMGTKVEFGDGQAFVGNAINTFDSDGKMYPLIYAGYAGNGDCLGVDNQYCTPGCLDANKTKGKIVLCDIDESVGTVLLQSDAIGMIAQSEDDDASNIYPLPATFLSADTTKGVKSYIDSEKKPQARILKSEAIRVPGAPIIASFSSRGPNIISKDVLKPDISAPGVDILAAFSPVASLSGVPQDKRSTAYSILSGTSMACPHATGAAAYVKSFHPDWSPAAIKSALMTTASPINEKYDVFDYGSGLIDPVKAIDPGLVYDAHEGDYIKMLCSEGYKTTQLELISGQSAANCTSATSSTPTKDLNYPSMTLSVGPTGPFFANFTRILTNVGPANSSYRARIIPRPQFKVRVRPTRLAFKALSEKKMFVVTVAGAMKNHRGRHLTVLDTSIVWSDGVHNVKSPIVVYAVTEPEKEFSTP